MHRQLLSSFDRERKHGRLLVMISRSWKQRSFRAMNETPKLIKQNEWKYALKQPAAQILHVLNGTSHIQHVCDFRKIITFIFIIRHAFFKFSKKLKGNNNPCQS